MFLDYSFMRVRIFCHAGVSKNDERRRVKNISRKREAGMVNESSFAAPSGRNSR
jgi:hypothetical protein